MNSGIPAFVTPKTHIFAISYSKPPVRLGSVGNATVAIILDLEYVW